MANTHSMTPQSLAQLFAVSSDTEDAWHPSEYAAILAHQLQSSLAQSLQRVGFDHSSDLCGHEGDVSKTLTFNDVLTATVPALDDVKRVKLFASLCSSLAEPPLPKSVCTFLYYWAVALALTHHSATITSLSQDAVQTGLAWAADQSWADATGRKACRQAIAA